MIQKAENGLGFDFTVLVIALALMLFRPGLLSKLWTSNGFIPHEHCYLWRLGLVWLLAIEFFHWRGLRLNLRYLGSLDLRAREDIPSHV